MTDSAVTPACSNLPESVRQLVEVLGIGPAMALVRAYGGTTVYVPARDRADGETARTLARIIGESLAGELINRYSGERLYVPRCADALRDWRAMQIQSAYDRGGRVADIARRHALSERQIWTILKRPISPTIPTELAVDSSRQGNLF